MKRTDNRPQWDAKRLIQAYFKMASLIKSNQGKPSDNIVWSDQIRIKRIASALRAFLEMKDVEEKPLDLIKSVFDGWNYECICENSRLLEEDREHLHALLKDAIADDHQYKSIMDMAESHRKEDTFHIEREKNRDRRFMLHVFLYICK